MLSWLLIEIIENGRRVVTHKFVVLIRGPVCNVTHDRSQMSGEFRSTGIRYS